MENCIQINVQEIPLNTILDNSLADNFINRLRIAGKIKRWVKENSNYHAVLIFSDYSFSYRTLVYFCRKFNKPIFIYQDGFIFFEPWAKNLFGILKGLIYNGLKFSGYSHLISYKSFHTNPDRIFSWGDYFSKTFRENVTSKVETLGSIMYAKGFEINHIEKSPSYKILYYCTFYRDFAKDRAVKSEGIDHFKNIIVTEGDLTCDIKLHPLDSNKVFLEHLLRQNSLRGQVHFLEANWRLQENLGKYRYIISELSTETIFASLFCSNIYFVKNGPAEKHYNVLRDFLKLQNIGDKEYYKLDLNLVDRFQSEYFQKFNVERFEQAVQNLN